MRRDADGIAGPNGQSFVPVGDCASQERQHVAAPVAQDNGRSRGPFTAQPLPPAMKESANIGKHGKSVSLGRCSSPRLPYRWCKRGLDVTVSAASLLLLLPLFVLIAAAIRLDSPGPVFFRQERVGLKGHLFTLYKFRSMFHGADEKIHREYFRRYAGGEPALTGNASSGEAFYLVVDDRVTRVGTWLRRTCFDELPQLLNVLKGDMSLVGPRPAIPYEVSECYQQWHMRRFDVLPGLTGIWQTNGRGSVPLDGMISMDLEYVEHRSLALDLKLMFLTVPALLKGRLK